MKKFITTAALVAASTALASAATVVFTTASSVSGATETVALVQKSTGKGAQTLTYTSDTTFSGASSTLSLAYAFTADTREWATEDSSSANTNAALSEAFTEATGLSLSDYAGKNFYGLGAGGQAATLTFTGLKANTEYRFSFVGAGRGGDSTLSIETGSLSDTTRGGGSFYGSMSGNNKAGITSTATLANAKTYDSNGKAIATYASSAATFVITSDSTGTVKFNATQKAGFVAIAVSDVIPEPSAFGLLAGIGALAFAVSRRRRSR